MAVLTVIKKLGPGVITAMPQRIATLNNIIVIFIIDVLELTQIYSIYRYHGYTTGHNGSQNLKYIADSQRLENKRSRAKNDPAL
jgi:hypothetical protein